MSAIELTNAELDMLRDGRKLDAICAVHRRTNAGLVECRDAVLYALDAEAAKAQRVRNAAPQLLVALELARDRLLDIAEDNEIGSPRVLSVANEAIAAARGGQ